MPHVLVVEDDPHIRELVALHLGLEGLEAMLIGDGREALDRLAATRFDLVVLDLMLPGVDGLTICRAMRRQGPNADTPVLMLTARGEEADKVLGLETGADDYLAKPFGTRELVARVRAVLRRGGSDRSDGQERSSEAHFNGWTLSFPRRELRTPDGAIVDLTGAEFDLLACFITNPQRVIARYRLIEMSRTRLGDSSDRSIDVLVSRLRRKLTTGDESAPIRTVRGIGYIFSSEVDYR